MDDAVAGVYRERYIYLIGGWSKTDAVRVVQVYDAQKNKWSQATPFRNAGVRRRRWAGGRHHCVCGRREQNPAGDQPKYVPSDECWLARSIIMT